jgi:signal transduction histidine kinase
MIRRSSLKWPIILGVTLLALIVALLVFWIVVQATQGEWALLLVGTVFCALILIGVVGYLVLTIKEVRLTRRQANFIDSVTHELKSPIASLKLCLQTMDLREVGPEQQREFHRFMLEDVQRLEQMIDHLLEAARLDHVQKVEPFEDVPADRLMESCIETVRRRYQLSDDQIELELHPCLFRGRFRDLEMIFVNLLDNAAKYAGQPPLIRIQVTPHGSNRVLARISDNGKGIRFEWRRKIFQRFVRGGSELERTTKGTGLGLYLVKTLVSRMKGRIHVSHRGPLRGATFEVDLPGFALAAEPAGDKGPGVIPPRVV